MSLCDMMGAIENGGSQLKEVAWFVSGWDDVECVG